MMSKRTLALAAALLLSCLAIIALTGGRSLVEASSYGFEGEAIAIRGGTVVTVTGATIPKGTVVIRGGLIAAVGADVPIPADARIIDATGMMVYPGLFDSYTNLGLPSPTPPAGGGGRGGGLPTQALALAIQAQGAAAAQPTPTPAGLSPEVRAADNLRIAAETFDGARSAGITTVLTSAREGVFQGQAAIINLGGTDVEKLIIKSPASLNISMERGGFGGYPTSLMGVISFLRQSFYDAQHYREVWARYEKNKRGMARPAADKSAEALQPYLNRELPVIIQANNAREIRRAIAFAEEFNLKYMITGGLQSGEVADLLKQKDVPVLLSLNYPQRPNNLEDPEDEPLRSIKARAEAPKSAAALHKAGVRFAFHSGYLAQPREMLANAARAIEAGLPKDAALKALTIAPAEIFGVSEQLGSLEAGKIANVIVTSGDLFERRTQVRYIFVDGVQYEVRQPTMAGGPGGRGPGGRGGPGGPGGPGGGAAMMAAGSWALQINLPQGPVPATLTLQAASGALTGEITSQFGVNKLTDVRLSGNEITFNYTINIQGNEVPASARGTIQGNSIRGTMSAAGQQVDFNGTRTPRSNE